MLKTAESWSHVLETAPCGLLTVSDDRTILIVNATLLELLGFERDELQGRRIDSILTPGNRVFYQTHLFPLLKLQGRADEIYLSLLRKDGEEIPVLVNAVRHDRDGMTVSDWALMRIDQRKLFEGAILEARRAAEEANAAKEKFLSMMSHDLRTPLQAVSGYATVLLEEFHGPLTDEQRTDVQEIKSAAGLVARMIDEILEFARLGRGAVSVDLQPVSIDEALTDAERMVRLRIEEAGLSYSRENRAAGAVAEADPHRLQQVLLNLLTNAIKFTRPGGSIRSICEADDRWLYLRIADSGVGIPPEKVAQIFEPFVQVEPDHRGVGLGLAISHELARAMGAELTVESTPGEGSTFTIKLRRR